MMMDVGGEWSSPIRGKGAGLPLRQRYLALTVAKHRILAKRRSTHARKLFPTPAKI